MAPDAVLLDLGLPDIDGKAVIMAIRERALLRSRRDRAAEPATHCASTGSKSTFPAAW
jgi:CheY-like chemotaxis protein